ELRAEIGLMPVFLTDSFRHAASSLLSLFSSIYIYKQVAFLTKDEHFAMVAVFGFFLVAYAIKFFINPEAGNLSRLWGLKREIYWGELLFIFTLLALFFSTWHPALFLLAAVLYGLSSGFYWFGHHCLMAKIGHNGLFGREIGVNNIIKAAILAGLPVFGGVIIASFGYQGLFLASLFLVVLSILVLRPASEEKTHHRTSLKEVLAVFGRHKKAFLAYFGNSAAGMIYSLAFPLYLFLILRKEISLGQFFSLSIILVMVINYFVGWWADAGKRQLLLTFGPLFSAAIWAGRAISRRVPFLLALDVAARLTGGMSDIPLNVLSYKKAQDGHSTGRAILFQETAGTLGEVFACLLVLLVVILGNDLAISFFLAALLSLLPLLIARGNQ
ncbi:MFS transporter, partial [Candidatus Shapirobacteria bacterium]|nr:MFS transporter [Candidatus Shapirobacteria bacterium]